MEFKKIKLIKSFYQSVGEIEIEIPVDIKFAEAQPTGSYRTGQVALVSIVNNNEETSVWLENNFGNINYIDIGLYYVLVIEAVDKTDQVEIVSMEELNNMFPDIKNMFIAYYDNDFNFYEICNIVKVVSAEHIMCRTVTYNPKAESNCSYSPNNLLSHSYLDIKDDLYESVLKKWFVDDDGKRFFDSALHQVLKIGGIDWKNEFVDENYDFEEYTRLLSETFEKIKKNIK